MKIKFLVVCLTGLCLYSNAIAEGLFKVKDIRIEGLERLEPSTVFTYLPLSVGDDFTSAKGEKIIKDLYSTGFFDDVQVEIMNNEILLTVIERPIVASVNVTGGKAISNKIIKTNLNNIGLMESKIFDPVMLKEIESGLETEYSQQGKSNAKVEAKVTKLEKNRVDVSLDITEGATTKIRNINFHGNNQYSDRTLRRQLDLSEKGILTFLSKSDILSTDKLQEDQINLVRFYKDRGYFDFKIQDLKVGDSEKPNGLDIDITVEEGQRYKWGDIVVTGDSAEVPLQELQDLTYRRATILSMFKQKTWFNQTYFQDIIQSIQDKMGESGYAQADINVKPIINHEDGTVGFELEITANKKFYVNQINISGNNKTKDEVIRRELRQVESSSFDTKKIERSKERMQLLGFFDEVNVEPVPVEGSDDLVDLNVKVKERSTGSVDLSVGYVQDDGIVFQGGLAEDNILGSGKSASMRVSTGGTSKSASISFTDPYFTKNGVALGYDLFWQKFDPDEIDASSYSTDTIGGQIRTSIPISEYDRLNIGLGVNHKKIKLYDRSPLYYRNFVEKYGNKALSIPFTLGWSRNTTNDAFWPTKGYIISADAEVALPGSDFQYYSLAHEQTWFFPVSKAFTLMASAKVGLINDYGKSDEVPFFQNYHAGGLGSVRGYDSNSIGPKINNWYGDVDYLGGTKVVSASLELLFPMPGLKNQKSVRWSLFVDAASVWDGKTYTLVDNIEYGNNYKSSFKNELRYSSGVAMTWLSPIGPLKISWAQPLKKKSSDRLQRFQFQIGRVF